MTSHLPPSGHANGATEAWREAAAKLRASAPYQELKRSAQSRDVVGLPVPAAAWISELLAEDTRRDVLVIVPHESEALAWSEAVRLFAGSPCVYFPAPTLSPYHEAEISLGVRAAEAVALRRIAHGEVSTVVTTPRALFRRLPQAVDFQPATLLIARDEDHPMEKLADHLARWGYKRSDLVFEVGQFAVRGGVFDVFPPGETLPIRLDFFGDTVDTIHRFEPDSQRSEESLDDVEIDPLSLYPEDAEVARRLADALEKQSGPAVSEEIAERLHQLRAEGRFDGWEHYLHLMASGNTLHLADLLDNALVIAVDPDALAAEVDHHAEMLDQEHRRRLGLKRLAITPELMEHPADDVRAVIDLAEIRVGDLFADTRSAVDFRGRLSENLQDQLPRFPREVETAGTRGERVAVVVAEEHRGRVVEMLETFDLDIRRHEGMNVELVTGELARGFQLPDAGLTVFGERQLIRRAPALRRAAAKKKNRPFGPFLSSIRDLKIGDYVVHADHGIGQFIALKTLGGESSSMSLPPELAGVQGGSAAQTEVMEISYASGKNLLLPLTRMDLVQKYSGIEGVAPRLDKLGGSSWTRTKTRIKKGMRDMAEELLKLYAERQMAEAPQMVGNDSDLTQRFDSAFEFDETPDQMEAIEAIREDLKQKLPMDRLLCGDVGFGKTEVAMRAAMSVVDNGHQVAVLAPTTILADQHLETFQRRFKGLPVNIEMLSRFRTAAEAREIQKKAEKGQIDILIGTHRLLMKEIGFPKLGLVIIDEEQRFGVAHKERLKKLRKNVHILAMSATPVPRTLQLSLAGVRDLSLIETPPRDRMAVETAILPFDAQLIREVVEFEVNRGGQVYYVYNRVETIEQMAGYLKETVPGLKVTVGHGQMDEAELSRRMHAFTAGEYQMLLATTIIENGIDIPNVNTMIVHRADRFGLSQLYQLRGRVGRSDQLGYCYLLVEADKILTQEARKRLDAIREFTELGAGFRVAGRDLEIRGAGNLLGAEQSGHITAVGIETYLKLLEETVAELRGDTTVEEAPSVMLDIPLAMAIPEEYISDENIRIEVYRRLAASEESQEELLAELRDRFGPPPDSVRLLLEAAEVKRRAEELRLQSITAKGGRLTLRLRQDTHIQPEQVIGFVEKYPKSRFSPSGALTVEGVSVTDALARSREILEQLAPAEEAA